MNQPGDNVKQFAILFRVKAKPGNQQKLGEFLQWDCKVSQQEQETLRFDVWVDPADEDAFYVYEAYQDQAAFDKHKENEPYKKWVLEVEPEWIADKEILFAGEPLCLLP